MDPAALTTEELRQTIVDALFDMAAGLEAPDWLEAGELELRRRDEAGQ